MRHYIQQKEEHMPELVAAKLVGERGKISLGTYRIYGENIKLFKFFSYELSPYKITNPLAFISSENRYELNITNDSKREDFVIIRMDYRY